MTTLATAGDVRNAGGLTKESEGGATDSQIISSLFTAQQHLIGLVSKADYIRISAYTESSGEEEIQERNAYKDAEARFAMSFLPFILSSAQLQSTGFKTDAAIGETKTHFGNEDDIMPLSEFWAEKAMLFIAPYLNDTTYYDEETDDLYGFESDDGDFTMLSI
jgi:hypothetical protein